MKVFLQSFGILFCLLCSVSHAGLKEQVEAMVKDPDPRVRFQLAFTLGEIEKSPDKTEALAQIALKDSNDLWVRFAILSSVDEDAVDLYERLFEKVAGNESPPEQVPQGLGDLIAGCAQIVGARNVPEEISRLLHVTADRESPRTEEFVLRGLQGLLQGFSLGETRGVEEEGIEIPLAKMLNSPSANTRAEAQKVARIVLPPGSAALMDTVEESLAFLQSEIEAASAEGRDEEGEWEYVEDDGEYEGGDYIEEEEEEINPEEGLVLDATEEERIRQTVLCLKTLSLGSIDRTGKVLGEFLNPRYPNSVQSAALDSLTSYPDPEVAHILVTHWRSLDPSMREKAIGVFFARKERVQVLLDAIESGTIEPWSLDSQRQAQLFNFPDPEVVERAKKLFDETQYDEDPALFEKFREALSLEGVAERGHAIYKERCSKCHKVGDEGVQVGPDWASVKANTKEALLTSILYPNRNIAPGFTDYVIETTSGKVITGLIKSSGDASITLRRAGGEEDTVLRRTIRRIENTRLSLMPVGLAEGLTPQDMADLLAFIHSAE